LIRLKRERDFRKIPNMQKAYMIIGQQLPSDICFFCGVKIDAGPKHSRSNIYIRKQCKKEGLTINDVNKGTDLGWICICKHRNDPGPKICSKCGWEPEK